MNLYLHLPGESLLNARACVANGENPWLVMLWAALTSSLVILLVFKVFSDPKAVRQAKNKLVAGLLELVLYKDDFAVTMDTLKRLGHANAAYLGKLAVPLLLGLIPMAVIYAMLSCWLNARPLRSGESAMAKVRMRPEFSAAALPVSLSSSANIAIETPALRIPRQNEINWRLRVKNAGDKEAWIELAVNGAAIRKDVFVEGAKSRFHAEHLWLPLLKAEAPLKSFIVTYPSRCFTMAGFPVAWPAMYLVLTAAIIMLLKKPLNVVL